MSANGKQVSHGTVSQRLWIAATMLEGAAKLDTTEDEKNILVDNALYLADRLMEKEDEERETRV